MTRELALIIRDDFDHQPGADTYTFSWLGTDYEIDLGPENFKVLERVIDKYLAVARPASTEDEAKPKPKYRSTQRARTQELRKIRTWWNENHVEPLPGGRIPRSIHDEYNRTHPDDQVAWKSR